MRSFPDARPARTTYRRLAVLTTCALALALLAVPGLGGASSGAPVAGVHAPEDELEQRRQRVRRDIRRADHALEESSQALRAATGQVRRTRTRLVAVRDWQRVVGGRVAAAERRDQQLHTQLTGARTRLRTARSALRQGRQDVAAQQVVTADSVADFYVQGDPELLAFSSLLQADDVGDATRQLSFLETVVGEEDTVYDGLRTAQVTLGTRETQVETARDAVAQRRRLAAAHLTRMQTLQTQATTAAQGVRRAVTASVQATRGARDARRADRQELRRLRAREAKIKRKILAAAASARARGEGYRGRTDGLLRRPVDASVSSPFGYRTHPIFGGRRMHDGTDFGAACGSPLRAAESGTVIEAYSSSSYGNRLFLSLGNFNGSNVTVVYNHMQGPGAVAVGDRVERGDRVGHVGTTGWSTGCHLHFTLLVDGVAVDPMPWL